MPKVKRAYHVDLSRAPDSRWSAMIRSERGRARKLISNCINEAQILAGATVLGSLAFKAARNLVPTIFRHFGSDFEFAADIRAWARGTGIPEADLIFANLIYELSQVGLCTAAAFDLPGPGGVGHVRNMDWPLTGCGPHSCMIHYEGACGPFTTLGWPGYVGVLSGVAPGRFSATINQAPRARRAPAIAWPASFALRYNFENSESFEDALEDLCATELSASAFFLVAGVEHGEGAVVEHTGPEAEVRRMRSGPIAVGNHYEISDFKFLNEENDPDSMSDSKSRRRHAASCVAPLLTRKSTPRRMLASLGSEPTLWELTAQRMAFVAKAGAWAALYEDTDAAVAEYLAHPEEDEEVDDDE